ncbi:hypothetical protein JVT61DRAFT_13636 [Boletus reticuloceps]|uniref:Uncharacterized protein n=1 Tax=Boletus reticuloceps TaxID=495285 RepID=A0A8I3A3B8_9AGAM|nr:hypothetical protein JVT61DRAFT_13636 [Boletus reticuloceps]
MESERRADEVVSGTTWQLRWLHRWYDRNVMDLSEYEIIHPLAMDEGNESQSTNAESSTQLPENVDADDIAMGDIVSDEEVVYTEWSLSSNHIASSPRYPEGTPNVQTPVTPWEIHAMNEMPAQGYTWKAVREAILRRREELMVVRFQRMPGLIRVIWDAHWEAHRHESLACMRFRMYVEEKIDVEAVERAPCQVEIRHMMDSMGKVEALQRYSVQGRRLYELEGRHLHMRMVPSDQLRDFYDGSLLEDWSR